MEKNVGALQKNRRNEMDELKNMSWPSPEKLEDYEWPTSSSVRGSVRLYSKRVVGSDKIDSEWRKSVNRVRKNLKS